MLADDIEAGGGSVFDVDALRAALERDGYALTEWVTLYQLMRDALRQPGALELLALLNGPGDSVVERAARAMADSDGLSWDILPDEPDAVCGNGMPEGCKAYWRSLARAALAAVKEAK